MTSPVMVAAPALMRPSRTPGSTRWVAGAVDLVDSDVSTELGAGASPVAGTRDPPGVDSGEPAVVGGAATLAAGADVAGVTVVRLPPWLGCPTACTPGDVLPGVAASGCPAMPALQPANSVVTASPAVPSSRVRREIRGRLDRFTPASSTYPRHPGKSERERRGDPWWGRRAVIASAVRGSPQEAADSSASRLRVCAGSTGMPGPMVVAKKTFFRYRPLAADGFARSTSSSAAA